MQVREAVRTSTDLDFRSLPRHVRSCFPWVAQAAAQGVVFYLVQDAGHTQVAPGSRTVLAVGPAPEVLCDQITGEFKLY